MSVVTRCKFVCNSKVKDVENNRICFAPVYSGSEENKEFFKHYPGGDISLFFTSDVVYDSFRVGNEYYVTFSPAS